MIDPADPLYGEEVAFWNDCIAARGAKFGYRFDEKMDPANVIREPVVSVAADQLPRTVKILDVGAGPLASVGKVWPGNAHNVVVHAIDPLAAVYDDILARNGIVPLVRTTFGEAENIAGADGINPPYDIVYSENALDHCNDPLAALLSIVSVLKPGAGALIYIFPNEGERQQYQGMHRWNFDVRDDGLHLWRPEPQEDILVNGQLVGAETLAASVEYPFYETVPLVAIRIRKAL